MPASLVVWQPLFTVDPRGREGETFRDYRRALEQWRGEAFVWCLPEIDRPRRFLDPEDPLKLVHLAIPSSALNRFSVYHIADVPGDEVGRERRVWPPLRIDKMPTVRLVEGLYIQWLRSSPSLVALPERLEMWRPVFSGESLVMEKGSVALEPADQLALRVDNEGRLRGFAPGLGPPPFQAIDSGPNLRRAEQGLILKDRRNATPLYEEILSGRKGLASLLVWPSPFDRLFPIDGGRFPLALSWARLEKCVVEIGRGDVDTAACKVSAWIGTLSDQVEVDYAQARIFPHLFSRGQEEAWQYAHQVGSRNYAFVHSLRDLQTAEGIEGLAQQKVAATALLGWDAYCWWEINDDLRSKRHLRLCANCGNPIRGGQRNRKYCGDRFEPEDQVTACERDRAKERSARSRRKQS